MLTSEQVKKLGRNATNESAIETPRLDEAARFKVASILKGFEKRALLNSDQVQELNRKAQQKSPITLRSPRLDDAQRVGWGSGAVE
jgi:hypothetical protein